jgi:uncharacterized small protein (DUF1192 family)
MGSFNDLVIARANSHEIGADEDGEANRHLNEVRTRIYVLARELAK